MTENTRKKITKWFWIFVTLPVALVLFVIFLILVFTR